ncbi:hypothetical protein [Legionella bozemanae]
MPGLNLTYYFHTDWYVLRPQFSLLLLALFGIAMGIAKNAIINGF